LNRDPTMKALTTLLLASAALATPAPQGKGKGKLGGGGRGGAYHELTQGSCKAVTFIFVRGTFEGEPVGAIIGPGLISAIRRKIPNLAAEGVKYAAAVGGNLVPGGGDPKGIAEAKKDYELAASKCPNTIIIGGGYSQGAAVTHRAVEQLSPAVKARIAGIVLYGDTQNKQSGGRIKGFPADRAKVFCNGYGELRSKSKDGVCGGSLGVNGGHMAYSGTFGSAADWLAKKVADFKGSKGGAAPAAEAGGDDE